LCQLELSFPRRPYVPAALFEWDSDAREPPSSTTHSHARPGATTDDVMEPLVQGTQPWVAELEGPSSFFSSDDDVFSPPSGPIVRASSSGSSDAAGVDATSDLSLCLPDEELRLYNVCNSASSGWARAGGVG